MFLVSFVIKCISSCYKKKTVCFVQQERKTARISQAFIFNLGVGLFSDKNLMKNSTLRNFRFPLPVGKNFTVEINWAKKKSTMFGNELIFEK